MTGLFIRFEMVKAMATTESLLFVVGRLFGEAEPEVEEVSSLTDMQAFVRAMNGG